MRFLIPILLLVTSLAHADGKELSVQYTSAEAVEAMLEFQAALTDVGGKLGISGRQPGTVKLAFSRTYSNRCVAGNHIVLPAANLTNDRITVALGQTFRKKMCPANFKPVVINYVVTLNGLKQDSTYNVTVGTKMKLFKKPVHVR